MDETLLGRIKNTLLVILKTRQEVTAVAILGSATEWELVPVYEEYPSQDELCGAMIFLPAELYARLPKKDRKRVEDLIGTTLDEITRSQEARFAWVRVVPKLVEYLTETQAELVGWMKETWPKELARVNPPDDDIPF